MNNARLDFSLDTPEVAVDVRLPKTVSFSQLSTFRQCPGKWAASKLVKQPDEWLSPLRLGSIVHAALEYAIHHPEFGNKPDWNRLCLLAIDEIRASNRQQGWGDEPAPAVTKPNGQIATDADWAEAAAAKLTAFQLPFALGRPLDPFATEMKITTTVEDIPLTGSVDYIDKSGAVVDWKTGKPSRDSSHADQVRLYAAMMEAAGYERPDAGFDVYVERCSSVEQDISFRATKRTVDGLRTVYDSMREQTSTGVFALQPSALCPWCPVARACPFAQIQGVKAMQAARKSIDNTDPRVRTHSTQQSMTGATMSVLSNMLTTGTQETQQPAPSTPAQQTDLWASAESLAKWGVAKADADATSNTGKQTPVIYGKPFQPSLLDGQINSAAYGVAHVFTDAGYAVRWCGKHSEWVDDVLQALLHTEHRAALKGWPQAVTVPTIDTREHLLAWLDTTVARDAGRIVVEEVNEQLALEAGSKEGVIAEIEQAGARAQAILAAGVRVLN